MHFFDSGPRLLVADNPAVEDADRITVEAWVNTLSWPIRAVVCRKDGSFILYNYSGGRVMSTAIRARSAGGSPARRTAP